MRLLPPILTVSFVLLAGVAAADSGSLTLTAFDRADVITLDLRAGETIDYSWTAAGGSVEFDVERVATGNTVYSRTGQVGQGTVTVSADGLYVFRFRNPGQTPTVLSWTVNRQNPGIWILVSLVFVIALIVLLGLWQRAQGTRRRQPPQFPLPPREPGHIGGTRNLTSPQISPAVPPAAFPPPVAVSLLPRPLVLRRPFLPTTILARHPLRNDGEPP